MITKNFYSIQRKAIKVLMKKKGIKTAELSRLANLNAGTVYEFLKDGTRMTVKNIDKLYAVLNQK